MGSSTRYLPARLAVHEYSRRFLEALDEGHAAASPLGAWALLALLARGAPSETRSKLEGFLFCDADEAFAYVRDLYEQQHPAVSLALAAWVDEDAFTRKWSDFVATLPAGVGGDAMPTPEVADAWMRKASHNRISTMPVPIQSDSAALLTSAVAMDGGWRKVLKVSSPGDLGPHELEGEFTRVLVQSEQHCALVGTDSAGVVGASVLETNEAFVVVSVMASADVSRSRAIAAAHEVAWGWDRFTYSSNLSLFDLPLGDHQDWNVTEQTFEAQWGPARLESSTIFIPEWEITESRIDLLKNPRFGYVDACAALEGLLAPGPHTFKAAQLATARFHQLGFSAAAGTALGRSFGAALEPKTCRKRMLELRFRRPYAVVVIAKSPREYMHWKRIPFPTPTGPHPWDHVPCFTAWVTRATEPEERVPEPPRLAPPVPRKFQFPPSR